MMISSWILDLAAVAGVVEEIGCSGFGDEPVYCCLFVASWSADVVDARGGGERRAKYQNIMPTRIILAPHIIP